MELLQRGYAVKGLLLSGKLPVFSQFGLMLALPFEHCCQSTSRKAAFDSSAPDFERYFILPIFSMKVRRRMVAIVHSYNNAEKATDFRH